MNNTSLAVRSGSADRAANRVTLPTRQAGLDRPVVPRFARPIAAATRHAGQSGYGRGGRVGTRRDGRVVTSGRDRVGREDNSPSR